MRSKALFIVVCLWSLMSLLHAQANSSLSFDGTDDYIKLPSISNVRSIAFWINISSNNGDNDYLIDARTGLSNGYYHPDGGLGSGWSKLYMNGTQLSNTAFSNLTKDTWIFIYLEASEAFTDDVSFMAHHDAVEGGYTSNVYLEFR